MLSSTLTPWFSLLLATVSTSFGLTGVFTWYARRRGMYDVPAERHSHTEPTPRGGGAGLVITVILASILMYRYGLTSGFWPVCALPGFVVLALVGWWDDRVSLSALLRFLVQLGVSIYLLGCLGAVGMAAGLWASIVAGIFLMWTINLYNFMDGSNGMAGFQGVFVGVVSCFLFLRAGDTATALLSAVLAAACLGFLPWNLGRARVFLGDVASGSLGFCFGAILIFGVISGSLAAPVAWLVMLVFLGDASLTLLARVIRGERWYNPHKEHLYQRLISGGWTHGRVVLLYQLINLVLVVPAIAVAVNYPASAMVVASVASLALGTGWLLAQKKLGVLALARKG